MTSRFLGDGNTSIKFSLTVQILPGFSLTGCFGPIRHLLNSKLLAGWRLWTHGVLKLPAIVQTVYWSSILRVVMEGGVCETHVFFFKRFIHPHTISCTGLKLILTA